MDNEVEHQQSKHTHVQLSPRTPEYNVEGSENAHLGFDLFVFSEHLQNLRVNIAARGCGVQRVSYGFDFIVHLRSLIRYLIRCC